MSPPGNGKEPESAHPGSSQQPSQLGSSSPNGTEPSAAEQGASRLAMLDKLYNAGLALIPQKAVGEKKKLPIPPTWKQF